MSKARLHIVIEDMHKEANVFSGLVNAAKGNVGATVGAAAGGLYSGYQGAQGPEGGVKGALVGGVQGALGGAIGGYALQHAGKAVVGKNNVFSQFGKNTKKINEAAKESLGGQQRTGFMSNFRNRRAYAKTQKDSVNKVKDNIRDIQAQADAGLIKNRDAMKMIDAQNASNLVTQRAALRNQMVFGGLGTAMALGTGKGLISEGAKSGKGADDKAIAQNLYQKYKTTGKLDDREMRLLTQKMQKLQ